jgi:hypothetical protein
MANCNPLTNLSRECSKATASGIRDEVYLVSFDSLKSISGSTEVFSTSVSGLVNAISFVSGSTKFVKYGTVKNQNDIKENYSQSENGSYDITKELTFSLSGVGSIDGKNAVENLIANPVVALVKLRSGSSIIFGLNGQFSMSGSAGTVNSTSNGRVITLSGSDTEFIQIVDPTILSTILSA